MHSVCISRGVTMRRMWRALHLIPLCVQAKIRMLGIIVRNAPDLVSMFPDSGMFRWIVPWLSCRSWCIKYGVMDGVLCRENHQAKHSAVKNLPDSA